MQKSVNIFEKTSNKAVFYKIYSILLTINDFENSWVLC